MDEIKLLILDDDKKVIETYKGVIKRVNREGGIQYKEYITTNLDEARECIKYYKLDTAIIDLNLCADSGDSKNADGNQAIEELMKYFRMPIFVVTGEPAKLEEKFRDNNLIKLYPRDKFMSDSGIEEIIPKLFSSNNIQYFSRDGFLEQMINEFYWNHLSFTIDSWGKVAEKHDDEIDKILSRHTVSCLNEQFYVNGNIGSFDRYHPGEMYIIPPIKNHYHTGDIIVKENKKFIILNPACDIVNMNKLNFYVLAELRKLDASFFTEKDIKTDQVYTNFYASLNKKAKDLFDRFKNNNQGANFHYLPEFNAIETDYLIDFQNLVVVNIGEDKIEKIKGESKEDFFQRYLTNRETFIVDFERIASISSPFLKDIIAKFSAYYARQGQPNLL